MMVDDLFEHFKKYRIEPQSKAAKFIESRRGVNETTWEIAQLWSDAAAFGPNLIHFDNLFELLCFYSLLGEQEDTSQRALITARQLFNIASVGCRINKEFEELEKPRTMRDLNEHD